jgi:uncharacterized protein (TIGR01244 family)
MNSTFSKFFSNKAIFGLSVILGVIYVVASFGYAHFTKAPPLKFRRLTPDISVAEQIRTESVPQLQLLGFSTIIDMRPDGEVADQPAAVAVETAVHANHMHFSYVPVPHGDIPADAVTALAKAIAENPRPILLYCRSGRRAARTWSLVEASRPGGLDAADILAAVKAGGQSAEDLNGAIAQRIANRTKSAGGAK